MMDVREKRAKISVIVTLLLQIVTLICGLVVPRVLIGAYGSEAYGATMSIAQFLSYITLFEGGIGGVARAALYKPLADNDQYRISMIMQELQRFFRVLAYISIIYAVGLACSFKALSQIKSYDWLSTAFLVIVIALSTFGQYFIGISYSALIQADQRMYILNVLSIITTILNAVMVILLVNLGSGLIFVKLVSSCVYLIKPLIMWRYAKKKYGLIKVKERDTKALDQRWAGLGQHIAYYIHSNTDVAVLTFFDSLKAVSVYSVYNMITANIQNVVLSVCSGMEAMFGDMLAHNEQENLNRTFAFYETLVSMVSVVLFSVVCVMIIPFVRLYTYGIEDVNYLQPVFGIFLAMAAFIYCVRMPYQSIIVAAGHFKQTQAGAYFEAVLNLGFSLVLVWKFGLKGVAIGTIIAVLFRFGYNAVYLSLHVLRRSVWYCVRREVVNGLSIVLIYIFGYFFTEWVDIDGYFKWTLVAFLMTVVAGVITCSINYLLYRNEYLAILNKLHIRKK